MDERTSLEQSVKDMAQLYAAIEAMKPLIKPALEKAMEAAMRKLPADDRVLY